MPRFHVLLAVGLVLTVLFAVAIRFADIKRVLRMARERSYSDSLEASSTERDDWITQAYEVSEAAPH